MSEKIQIRNSTVDFLVFTRDAGDDGIEVRVQNNDVWLTQKAIAQLFDVDRSVVSKHLSNIFKDGELDENSVCAKFAQTAVYLLTLLTFPYFQGFPPLKILYMYPFPLFLPLWDNYKGKFIIQLFNRCLPLYQEVLRKSALLPL